MLKMFGVLGIGIAFAGAVVNNEKLFELGLLCIIVSGIVALPWRGRER
jgi:hypothetical protein